MPFAFTAEQKMLRDSVRDYLATRIPPTRVRVMMESEAGYDDEVWREFADMGWQGIAIPEAYGGAGFSFRELGILLEEMGRALTPAPFLSSVVLGARTLLIGGSEEQKHAVLPGVVEGTTRLAVAIIEPDGRWDPSKIATTATATGDEMVIDGAKSFVLDGHTADRLIVAARNDADQIDLFLVDGEAAGVARRRIETMDQTRKQAEVVLDGVKVPASARLGDPGSGSATLAALYDEAVIALAHEQVGGAEHCLEMSVEYAGVRHQFGRPIGSFQAIKHKLADMLVQLEAARSAAQYAGWALAEDAGDVGIAAATAKSACSEAFFEIASETIQIHGGIGFTWEHDAHLYLKRAQTDLLLFGNPAQWRARLAARLDY